MQSSSPAVRAFHELHRSGCFVMPNPWDIGSAKLLHHLGFKALASTSAGVAFSLGKPDSVTSLERDDVLKHLTSLVEATLLPVNADFQNGYAHDPESVAANVTMCLGTGVAGLSLEDASGLDTSPLYERSLAIERIKAARSAIDAAGTETLLTARCEAILLGLHEAERMVLDRLVAYADAGADCLYAPRVASLQMVESIVSAVAPKPVNILVARPMAGFTVKGLAEIGVRRISVGSAFSRLALGAVLRSAKEIMETGEFGSLGEAMGFGEVNGVMEGR